MCNGLRVKSSIMTHLMPRLTSGHSHVRTLSSRYSNGFLKKKSEVRSLHLLLALMASFLVIHWLDNALYLSFHRHYTHQKILDSVRHQMQEETLTKWLQICTKVCLESYFWLLHSHTYTSDTLLLGCFFLGPDLSALLCHDNLSPCIPSDWSNTIYLIWLVKKNNTHLNAFFFFFFYSYMYRHHAHMLEWGEKN